MRRFQLLRAEDVSGVSGTGVVAEGVQFTCGVCVLVWLGPVSSVVVHESIANVRRIHGHDGKSVVVWLDPEGGCDGADAGSTDGASQHGHDRG
jgi:hypothetical protein